MIPYTNFLNPNDHKSKELGEVTASAKTIIKKGLECIENFGTYHPIARNCQEFCKEFAGVLTVKQLKTDAEVTVEFAVDITLEVMNTIWKTLTLSAEGTAC